MIFTKVWPTTSDCPPPVFVPEGEDAAAQPHTDDESNVPLNAPDRASPNILFVESDDAPVASDDVLILTPPINLIPSIYAKASKFGNVNLAVSVEPTKLPVPLDTSRFQFVLPYSPVRNLRANNAIVFGMRFVILC